MPPPKITEREVAWRCLNTLKSMFEFRKRPTSDFDFIGNGPSEMMIADEKTPLLKSISKIYNGTYILFDCSYGKSVISDLTKYLDDHPQVREAILVIFSTEFVVQKMKKLTTLTPQATAAARLLETQRNVQVFFAIELMTNIMSSRLQPKIRVLSEEEGKQIISAYAALPPPIFSTDPVVKFLGAKPGTVLEIETPSTSFIGTSTFSYSIVTAEENEEVEEN